MIKAFNAGKITDKDDVQIYKDNSNFTFENMKAAVNLVDGKYETEASGGITIENVQAYAACGVSHISLGALTHSVKSLDLSLKAF